MSGRRSKARASSMVGFLLPVFDRACFGAIIRSSFNERGGCHFPSGRAGVTHVESPCDRCRHGF
jgi:hypothetical protein